MGECWIYVCQNDLPKGFHMDGNSGIYKIDLLLDGGACDYNVGVFGYEKHIRNENHNLKFHIKQTYHIHPLPK